jgi:hypothetical protein
MIEDGIAPESAPGPRLAAGRLGSLAERPVDVGVIADDAGRKIILVARGSDLVQCHLASLIEIEYHKRGPEVSEPGAEVAHGGAFEGDAGSGCSIDESRRGHEIASDQEHRGHGCEPKCDFVVVEKRTGRRARNETDLCSARGLGYRGSTVAQVLSRGGPEEIPAA